VTLARPAVKLSPAARVSRGGVGHHGDREDRARRAVLLVLLVALGVIAGHVGPVASPFP
jgi:hypothetical protein